MTRTDAERQKEYRERKRERDKAAERGRLYGEDEVRKRGEKGAKAQARIQRAINYGIWEYEESKR